MIPQYTIVAMMSSMRGGIKAACPCYTLPSGKMVTLITCCTQVIISPSVWSLALPQCPGGSCSPRVQVECEISAPAGPECKSQFSWEVLSELCPKSCSGRLGAAEYDPGMTWNWFESSETRAPERRRTGGVANLQQKHEQHTMSCVYWSTT